MGTYRNPAYWSDDTLDRNLQGMLESANRRIRQFQKSRQSKSLYSGDFEGLAARNKQKYGQEKLPNFKKLQSQSRQEKEIAYKRAQEMLNIGSTREVRAEIRKSAAQLFDRMGVPMPKKFGFEAQKAVSDFFGSDEWKAVYSQGSKDAFDLLADTMAGVENAGSPKEWQRVREVFSQFVADVEV